MPQVKDDPVVVIEPDAKRISKRTETVTADSAAAKAAAIERRAAAVARVRAGLARVRSREEHQEELKEAMQSFEQGTPSALGLIEQLQSRAASDEAMQRLAKTFQMTEEEKAEVVRSQQAQRERFDAIVRGEAPGKSQAPQGSAETTQATVAAPVALKTSETATAPAQKKSEAAPFLKKSDESVGRGALSGRAQSTASLAGCLFWVQLLVAGLIGAVAAFGLDRWVLSPWGVLPDPVLYCDSQAVKNAALRSFLESPAALARLRRDWDGCLSEGLASVAGQTGAVIIDSRALLATGRPAADATDLVLEAVLDAAREATPAEKAP